MPAARPDTVRVWTGTIAAVALLMASAEVSRYFMTEINQTGDPLLLWGVKGGWVLGGVAGLILALVASRPTAIGPALVLGVVALLLATVTWMFYTESDWTISITAHIPRTVANVAIRSVQFNHFLVGFSAGWLITSRTRSEHSR